MVTRGSSVSQGHYGLMATVWLALIAMFLGILSFSLKAAEQGEEPPASPLEALAAPVRAGEAPRTSAPIPVEFFNGQSAALTEAGRDWLRLFAERAPVMRPGERFRLDILPPARSPELTAARVAATAAMLGSVNADMGLVEIRTHGAGEGARLRLAGEAA